MIKHCVLWSWDFGSCCCYFIVFSMYLEEGVNHSKRTNDNTWCVMVMGFLGIVVISLI